MTEPINDPHTLTTNDVLAKLSSNAAGLSQKEADQRLQSFGPNELPEGKTTSIFEILLKQFKNWLVIILIIAAVISWWAGQHIDAWVIVAVVLVNAAIGFSQEYRAEKAIASLRKMIVKVAKVWRDGQLMTIRSAQLVPGDIMTLEEGDSIPADARIIEAKNFRTIEASLTGESLPISKTTEALQTSASLGDRKNMVWKGTFVAGGYARAVVTGTGINTAIGNISTILGSVTDRRTNFMKKTDVLARQMSVIAISSAAVIFLVGYFIRKFEIQEILLTSIAALVAAVPEGLPAVISVVLAIGANRMAKRNAIIREFTATETLGAVSAILTDKTGTLTQNSLTARKVFLPGSDSDYTVTGEGWFPGGNFMHKNTIVEPEGDTVLDELLRIAAISNNSNIRHNKESNTYELIGDPTEGALLVMAKKGGLKPDSLRQDKMDDLPFDSILKLRASLVAHQSRYKLMVTGAPEKLLKMSSALLTPEGEISFTEEDKESINRKIADLTDEAMRVIGLAYKIQDAADIDAGQIDQLVFVGLVGMIDPPRPDSKEAVIKCKKAGIRVVMVTGDHINTAVAIARATGIIEAEDDNDVVALNEQQLLQFDEKEFDEAIQSISVFARLSPAMKLRIASRLQAMGHLIAMTGDGVNDAPALKKADVGVSMGIMGTDVARDASDVVLADDNFSTIVSAVEEGRIVFTNARQTSFFLVATNLAESLTILTSITIGLPLPLTATQILWLNLVTDGVSDVALATEPGHGDVMKRKPSLQSDNILNKAILPFLLIIVILMVGLSLATFFYFIDQGIEKARTGVFIVMAFTQLFNVFNLRSTELSVFKIGMFSNKYINLAIGFSTAALILVTEFQPLASIFRFQSLTVVQFLTLFCLSSSVLWSGEVFKRFKRK